MLFDIYFSLASFYIGACTAFAYTTKANGTAHAIGIAVGTFLVCGWGSAVRWHLRRHANKEGWSLIRRLIPIALYTIGFCLVIRAR